MKVLQAPILTCNALFNNFSTHVHTYVCKLPFAVPYLYTVYVHTYFVLYIFTHIQILLLILIVEHLWSEDELYEMSYGKKIIKPFPSEQLALLDEVILLLLTVNSNEDNAAVCYLEPLTGHTEIYRYMQRHDVNVNTHHAIYLIGKYGACTAAIRKIKPGSEFSGATTVPSLAFQCFHNLSMIIGVGVACGVEKRADILDVLVADKVSNYDQAKLQEGGYLSRGLIMPASDVLTDLFRQTIPWPDDNIKKRLDKHNIPKPKIKQGVILSGPYLINDKSKKKEIIDNFAPEAIGIEMEAAYLFKAAVNIQIQMTIVKAVCDFGDGNKNDHFQPTAALLAANCVKNYLSDPNVPNMLCKNPGKYTDKD